MSTISHEPNMGQTPVEVPKEYNKRKYEMIQLAGQSAALRRLDLRHRKDVQRMWDIDHSLGTEKYFDSMPDTDEAVFLEGNRPINPRRTWKEDLDWFKKKCEKEGVLYTVVKGASSTKGGNSSPLSNEVGELQGWVFVYKSDVPKDELTKLTKDGESLPAFDITYIRLPDGEKGIMQSGVSQVLWDIARMNGASDLKNESDAIAPSVLVCAAIEADNAASVVLAESVGFQFVGKDLVPSEKTRMIDGKEVEIPYRSNLYVVDWAAHERALKNVSEKVLFPDASRAA